jgi:hypothetical protein
MTKPHYACGCGAPGMPPRALATETNVTKRKTTSRPLGVGCSSFEFLTNEGQNKMAMVPSRKKK